MPDPTTTITNAAVGLVAGILYGVLWFARKRQSSNEPFNRYKFAGTLILSAAVGVAYGLSGQEVTPESIGAAIVANAGLLALAEPVLKSLADGLGVLPNYAG